MSQVDAFLNIYPKLIPLNSKCMPFKSRKSKMERQYIDQRTSPLNTQSLMSKYSELCIKHSHKQLSPRNKPPHRTKHSLSALKDYQNSLATIENKNREPQKVQNAISSVNDYAEELKTTLVKDYRHKKHKSNRKAYRILEEFNSQKNLIRKEQEENPQSISIKSPLSTKYSDKNMALKTINILYKAIIDQSLHKRDKQQFQLQANKLPIIDRFGSTNRRITQKKQQPLVEKIGIRALQQRRTMAAYHIPQPREKGWGYPSERRIIREDVDIVPWSIEEDRLE